MLETWIRHTVYVILIELHHRNMANHHQSWYFRLFLQPKATWYTCTTISYQATLYTILSYSIPNGNIHIHH